MARTFKDAIITDASGAFLNANEFAVSCRHYKAGSSGDYETITVVVDQDEETSDIGGSDSADPDTPDRGAVIRRYRRLEMLASIDVTEEGQGEERSRASVFRYLDGSGNKKWVQAVRVLGRDDAMQTVLCIEASRKSVARLDRR